MTEPGEATPRFSVVIPTFQRREAVCAGVCALARQRHAPPFEVIVVVDGSTDGSMGALSRLEVRFPLRVLEQPNRGAAAARNAGAAVARGDVLLFLDDDMEAHPKLLAEHDASHRHGADAVLGHLPLHPDSPRNILSVGVGAWAEERRIRLARPDARLTLHDLLTGQLSIGRRAFEEFGAFDELRFTRGGAFGGEDLDFGYRLLQAGCNVVFNPDAISSQRYLVSPEQHYRQCRDAGRSDVQLVRKHPELAREVAALAGVATWRNRVLLEPLPRLPMLGTLALGALRAVVVAQILRGHEDMMTQRLVFGMRKLEYVRGALEERRRAKLGSVTVLAYHAIANLVSDPVLGTYAVAPERFVGHLDALARLRCRFVSLDELIASLDGQSPLPRRGVLLTFDDCYADLLDVVAPALAARRIPAVAFAVSDHLGGTNAWDSVFGASRLGLLDAKALVELGKQGIEIGSHSRSHRDLRSLDGDELRRELSESRSALTQAGVPVPRAFCYPYGLWNRHAATAARAAGYDVAFTLAPGRIRAGADRHALPRTEIRSGDVGLRFLWKLATAFMRLAAAPASNR